MVEVTRVPLQPLKKGSLAKLWLALAAVVLAGAAMAYVTVPKGVSVTEIKAGLGKSPTIEDVVFVKYKGMLADGTVFDESQDFPVPVPGIFPEGTPLLLQEMIPGFQEGIVQMQKGGKYTLFIPSEKAYGANPQPGSPIPPNADLTFEIEIVDFMSRADMDRRVQTIQQMMQMQQQAQQGEAGANGAAPGDAPPIADPATAQ